MENSAVKREALGTGIFALTTPLHSFGADAVLLADFAAPRGERRLCDLCAGCGIVSLLWSRDGAFAIDAVELRQEAADLARRAAEENGLENVQVWEKDLRMLPSSWNGVYGLVACNPPYRALGTGPASPSPAARDARSEVSCTLADAVGTGARLLKNGGRLCFCHRPERLAELLCRMHGAGVEPKRLRFVQHKASSSPFLALVEGKKSARPGLSVEAVLILQEENGEPTPEFRRIYRM